MKKRLAICDRDERYLQSMQNYLMKRLTQFEVITFATLQEASDYSKKQAFAICLLSESLYEKDLYGMQALEILILKENGKKEITEYPVKGQDGLLNGHGGGDKGIVGALHAYLCGTYEGFSASDIRTSVDNHHLVFAAEKSRLEDRVVTLEEYIKSL